MTEGLTCDIIAGPVFIYEVKTLTHFCMRILWGKVGGKVFMVSVIASSYYYLLSCVNLSSPDDLMAVAPGSIQSRSFDLTFPTAVF